MRPSLFGWAAPVLVACALSSSSRSARAQEGGAVVIEEPPATTPAVATGPHLNEAIVGLDVGYARESLYSTPINALDFSLSLGGDFGHLSAGAILEVTPGWTREGLDTTGVNLGGFIEARLGRFRLGGGLRIGRFSVARATYGSDLATASSGMFFRVSFDLIPFSDHGALYLVGKGTLDDVGAYLLGATVGLGVRF
jgi:hypothetical protein